MDAILDADVIYMLMCVILPDLRCFTIPAQRRKFAWRVPPDKRDLMPCSATVSHSLKIAGYVSVLWNST